jgi:hypothetical protein
MPRPDSAEPVKVFISYRRDDSRAYAGWLDYCLEQAYDDADAVFRDVGDLEPGTRFQQVIENAVRQSDVFLCLIGKVWSSLSGSDGTPRLHHPDDPVRAELETAFRLKKPIIPILLEGIPMPAKADLPDSIQAVTDRNAHPMSDRTWKADVQKLLSTIQNVKLERGPKPKLSGRDIYDRFHSAHLPPKWVGRVGGLHGRPFMEDIDSGRWEAWPYEIKMGGPAPNKNWFSANHFVAAVDKQRS